MDVIRIEPGTPAAETEDRVYIDRLSDGKVAWAGSIDVGGAAVFGTSRDHHDTFEAAEAEAIAWAVSHGAAELRIETNDA